MLSRQSCSYQIPEWSSLYFLETFGKTDNNEAALYYRACNENDSVFIDQKKCTTGTLVRFSKNLLSLTVRQKKRGLH